MTESIEIFKKYGALGVIAVWLFMTNKRVDTLETQLHDCNEDRIDIYKEYTKPFRSTNNNRKPVFLAVLPEKVKIKNQQDEKRND